MKQIHHILYMFLLVIGAMAFSSCGEDEGDGLSNEEQIEKYLSDNGLRAEKTASGLYYIIDVPGGAEKPRSNSVVQVGYKGYLLNGDVFDSSPQLEISLTRVIPGWTEGIALFGRGGKGSLFIPSQLAYGPNGQGPIGRNTPIAFDNRVI